MGREFLEHTETLSRFPGRMKRFMERASQFWRVFHLEKPRRMLKCSVNGKFCLVNADSGSEVDLISRQYALSRGYKISKLQKGKSRVQFANGEAVLLAGTVEVDLSIPGADRGTMTLHVLDGLTSDILLGDDTLERLQAFTCHQDAFVDVEVLHDHFDLQYIVWYNAAENKIKHAFSKLLKREMSGSHIPIRETQPQSESMYHDLVQAFDKPTAKQILLQGMNFEKRLQAYDYREDRRQEEATVRIRGMQDAVKDDAIIEENLRKRRVSADRKTAIEKYEAALTARLASESRTHARRS